MIKRLAKHGSSLALVIDLPILKLLGLNAQSKVTLSTDGKRLIVTPLPFPELEDKLAAAMQDDAKMDRVLKELLG